MNRNELIYFPTWTAGREGYAQRIRQVFEDYLRRRQLFLTSQRTAILNELLGAERHLSQKDLYSKVKGRGIGLVTVFRTLKMLEEAGLVETVHDAEGIARYEVKLERPHHDHLICISCNRITEIQWPDVEKIQEKAARQREFEVLYHRHEIYGRCAQCRGKPT